MPVRLSEIGIIAAGALIVFGVACTAYFGIPIVHSVLSRFQLARASARHRVLAVTLDDGPGSILTPEVLELLAAHGAKASFFPLGRNIEGREDLLRRVIAEGHEICSHGYSHLNHWKVSPFRTVSDIKRGWGTIDAALGVAGRVYPFRPPEGKLNLVTLCYLLWKRSSIVYWTVDSGDTWTGGAPRDAAKVARALEERGGAVVLYHDFDRCDPRTCEFVIESLEHALNAAEAAGARCTTVIDLMMTAKQ